MKKNKRIFLIAFITIVTIFSSINFVNINVSYANEEKSLLNISECSSSFMANYFEGSKEIRESDNKENVLIVTSTTKVKDGKGASKIVAAPNNQYILQYDSEEEKDKALESFKAQKNIISVEENVIRTFCATDYNSWGIEKTGLDQAIEAANAKKLEDVTVAIIDTGCDMELFNDNYSGKIVETHNVYDNKAMYDNYGHGTHIAGTIAEGTPDNVKILPIKVSDGRTLDTLDIIEAINYVVHNKKADVINMSFCGYGYSEAEYQAIEAANKNNIICVAAAGNENTSTRSYPASFDNTISVSSVDSELKKSSFSNYGPTITFAAPGTDIESINGTMSGTSMATPHAVCAAAILKSYNKDYTLEDTIEVLRKYAIDLGDEGRDNYFGYGLINLAGITYCDCNCDDCDSIYCKECDCRNCIFEEKVPRELERIEVTSVELLRYNYGSITNLSNLEIGLTYTDGFYETKKLNEIIKDCTITGYNPDSITKQTVIIKYNGKETSFEITQPSVQEAWRYEKIDEKNIRITEFNKWTSDNFSTLYIPEKINGYIVVSIGEGVFKNRYDIENYIIPNSVTTVESEAFYNNYDTKSIKANRIAVGESAFEKCNKLDNFDAHVTALAEYSFAYCGKLENIFLSNDILSIPNYAFFSARITKSPLVSGINLQSIGKYAFANTFLESVYIPGNVTDIGSCAFFNCYFLENVSLQPGLEKIGDSAFDTCYLLKSINIPKTVVEIGEDAFCACPSLATIKVDGLNSIYDSRDKCNAIIHTKSNKLITGCKATEIPSSVKTIGKYAFADNISIFKLVIPEGVEKIERTAFMGCSNLQEITIPRSVTEIGTNALKISDFSNELIVWVYKDSYAETYCKDNSLNYKILDAKITNVDVFVNKIAYKAFQTVDTNGMHITVSYDDGRTEKIYEGISIKYNGENTSFRYGDTYFTVSAYTGIKEYIEKKVDVTVIKATPIISFSPEYKLYGNLWDSLADIKLPNGFEWMDKTQVLQEMGEFVYKMRYIPEDTHNYEILENIEVKVVVGYAVRTEWEVSLPQKEYKAFEKVDANGLCVVIKYRCGKVDYIKENLTIEYGNGLDSFRYSEEGWESVYVSGYGSDGGYFKYHVNVTVSKATPQYTVPTGIKAQVGQRLSEIALPSGFTWMDDSQIISEAGDVTYKARYTPEDTNNYEIVENIDIHINASKISVKIPTAVAKTYIYTGSDQYLLLMNFDDSKMKITGNVRKDVGEQTAIVSLLNSNYVWEDGTTREIKFTFKIEKASYTVTAGDYVGVYDGNAHSINLNINTTGYTIKYIVIKKLVKIMI